MIVATSVRRSAWRILAAFGLTTAALSACGSPPVVAPLPADEVSHAAANATYRFQAQEVTLVNGTAEQPVSGSAVKTVTSLTPMQASGELAGSGKSDAVVLLTQAGGKVGTFSYVAVLLADAVGHLTSISTNVQLVGDRVIVQNMRVDRGTITVDFLDYNTGQTKQSPPSLAQSKRFKVVAGSLTRT